MAIDFAKLARWALTGMLTPTRTHGQIGLNKNGGFIDIWVRVNGKPQWIAVHKDELQQFLSDNNLKSTKLYAESDGNAEEGE